MLLNCLSALLLLSALLFRFSATFRYYAKIAFLVTFYIVDGFLLLVYSIVHYGQYRRNQLFGFQMLDTAADVLGIRWRIEEEEKGALDRSKAYIVVCNHQSILDVMVMGKIWPLLGPATAVAKKELQFFSGPFGLALTLCGVIFVDRFSRSKGQMTVNQAAAKAKADGTSIWVFPEGTRNRKKDGTLLPFKKGAFHMALDAGMPILPIVVTEFSFYDARQKRFEPGEATIRILKPIPTDGYSKNDLDKLIDNTREIMTKEVNSMAKRD